MKKNIMAVFLMVIVIAIVFIYLIFNQNNKDNQPLTLYGNVDIRQVALAFELSGRIVSLNVEEGTSVKKGDILAEIDTEALQIQARQAEALLSVHAQEILKQKAGTRSEEIAQAEAQLLSANAQLNKANKDLQRLQQLNDRANGQAVSEQEFDLAKSNLEVFTALIKEREAHLLLLKTGTRAEDRAIAQAQYKAQEANLALINHQIAQGILYSPVDAVVRARLQEVGDMTTPQKSVYTLALTHPKWIRAYVNEVDLSRIHMGEMAEILSDSKPNQPIIGQVGFIASVAEFTPKSVQTEDIRTTLVYEIRIYVDDPKDELKMGQPVTIKLPIINDAQ